MLTLADLKPPVASIHRSANDNQQGPLHDADTTTRAAELVIRLLELRPLSPRPPHEVCVAVTAQHCNQNTDGNTTRQLVVEPTGATSSNQAQASHQPETWPTPKPNEWHDVKLVAAKACMSLDWALSLTKVQGLPGETLHRLTATLCQLLQRLVAGHLPDLDLDMQDLLRAGVHPILTAQLEGHADCTGPPAAMLSRLTMDSSLIPVGSAHATSKYSIV